MRFSLTFPKLDLLEQLFINTKLSSIPRGIYLQLVGPIEVYGNTTAVAPEVNFLSEKVLMIESNQIHKCNPVLPLIPQVISMWLIHGIIVSRNSIAVVSTCLNLEARDQKMDSFIGRVISPLILRVISMWLINLMTEFRNSTAVVST